MISKSVANNFSESVAMSSVHNVNKASDLLTKSYVKPSALIIWHKAEYTVDKAAVFPDFAILSFLNCIDRIFEMNHFLKFWCSKDGVSVLLFQIWLP